MYRDDDLRFNRRQAQGARPKSRRDLRLRGSHCDFLTIAVHPDDEERSRPLLDLLLHKDDMPEPVNGFGDPV
jgi:hypothetical protein